MGACKFCIVCILSWQLQGLMNVVAGQTLRLGYYSLTCPTAEVIVTNAVQQTFLTDNTMTASLIRLLFHDCFVNGCDASILLTGNNSEQATVPNNSVRGYGVITSVKTQLEAVCPGIVSCSDILALAARDSVRLLGGPAYQVPTGRLDGLVPGNVILPTPTDGVATAMPQFAAVGLSVLDMVVLLGAHSVGSSQCQFFSNRVYNFNNTGLPDPTLNSTYLVTLQNLCPLNGTGTTKVPLDNGSQFLLDTNYYRNVLSDSVLLTIDQDIGVHANTSAFVNNFAGRAKTLNLTFSTSFAASMIKLSSIGLHTALNGEVRRVCEVPNS